MKIKEFIKHINKLRLNNKYSWYYFTGEVEGKNIQLKGMNTWLQVYEVDGVRYAGLMERNVSEFKKDLLEPFNVVGE